MIRHEDLNANDSSSIHFGKSVHELFSIDVNVVIEIKDKDGNVKELRTIHNTVTANGKAGIADQLLASPTLSKAGWMAIGSGTPGANALGTEITRVALATKTRSTNVVTHTATFNGAVSGAVEAGVFDAASVGNMWMSTTFGVFNLSASDSATFTWTLTIN